MTPLGIKEERLEVSKKFEEVWNMPHFIGCIDGKHIRVKCPKLSGTLYYNCKGFFSIVLMALCDANYYFTLFDLGQYGSNNNSGILANSEMGNMFEEDQLLYQTANYLRLTDNAHYTPSGFFESEDKDGKFLPGELRLQKENGLNNNALIDLPHVRGSSSTNDALETRNGLRDFLNCEEGSLPW